MAEASAAQGALDDDTFAPRVKPLVRVKDVADRAITPKQLMRIRDAIRSRCARGRLWKTLNEKTGAPEERPLKAREVNLHHFIHTVGIPATRFQDGNTCSIMELLATTAQPPKVFVSHAWLGTVESFVAVVLQHAYDRGHSLDTPYWVCAFAINQHHPEIEITDSLRESPFFRAIQKADGTLTVVDDHLQVLRRVWCGYETYQALFGSGIGHVYDIYAQHKGGVVVGLVDGFLQADKQRAKKKASREAAFPAVVVQRARGFKLIAMDATKPKDKDNILADVGTEGERQLNATVHAKYFMAYSQAYSAPWWHPRLVLGLMPGSAFVRGCHELRLSVLRRIFVALEDRQRLPSVRLFARSLPPTVEELVLEVNHPEAADAVAEKLAGGSLPNLVFLDLKSNGVLAKGAASLAAALESNTKLTHLNLWDNRIADAGAAHLASAIGKGARVSKLLLGPNMLADDGLISLAAVLPGSTVVDLRLYRNSVSDGGVTRLAQALEANAPLMYLSLYHNDVGDEGVQALARALVSAKCHLTALDLEQNKLTNVGARALAEALRRNARLRSLKVWNNKLGPTGMTYLADALAKNSTLRWLDVDGNEGGDQGADALVRALRANKAVAGLNSSRNGLSEHAAKRLVSAARKHAPQRVVALCGLTADTPESLFAPAQPLLVVSFKGWGLSTADLHLLAHDVSARAAPALQNLDLRWNAISDAGVDAIADALASSPSLRIVHLAGNDFGDEGAKRLADALVSHASKVTTLHLEKNRIGDSGVEALAEAAPGLHTLQEVTVKPQRGQGPSARAAKKLRLSLLRPGGTSL